MAAHLLDFAHKNQINQFFRVDMGDEKHSKVGFQIPYAHP
jgi:hypothetical protein